MLNIHCQPRWRCTGLPVLRFLSLVCNRSKLTTLSKVGHFCTCNLREFSSDIFRDQESFILRGLLQNQKSTEVKTKLLFFPIKTAGKDFSIRGAMSIPDQGYVLGKCPMKAHNEFPGRKMYLRVMGHVWGAVFFHSGHGISSPYARP